MKQSSASPTSPAVNFGAATSLALTLEFGGTNPQHFGAPPASASPYSTAHFLGAVVQGASCNCQRITLIPHCHGTHTESASHLTVQQRPLQEIVPAGPVHALLLTVTPIGTHATSEGSLPAPRPADRLITREALRQQWRQFDGARPVALLLRTGTAWGDTAPPYLTSEFALELVALGVQHLVTDLPSVDRLEDEGQLTAHRIFFGLPAGSTDLDDAQRSQCTITELAQFPAALTDGLCAVQLQIPAFSGDAVPSRPLHLPLVRS